ncbi:MAG: DinB family protein [Ferruginibacter sp.]
MEQQLFIKMITDAWRAQNKKVDELLDQLTETQWSADTAPGKNTGIYLLGHLAAVNDSMLPLLGFGQKMYPELENIFLSSPDKSGQQFPSLADLKKYWNEINAVLNGHINNTQPADWFTQHTSVSAEDFAKEPHRNKLNILISRTIHQSYHLGQLAYLK